MQPTGATKRQDAGYLRKRASQFRKAEPRVTRRSLGEPGGVQPSVARDAIDSTGLGSPHPAQGSHPTAFRNSISK